MSSLELDASQVEREQLVAQWLLSTPGFFERHAELLTQMELANSHSGRAVSLQENVDAMYSLGECYLFGVGINKNVGKALDLFKLCVLKGSPEAIGTLYHMYDIMYCKEDHTLFFVKWIDGSKAWETREFMLNLEHPLSLDKVNSIPTLPLIVERKRKLETI